MVVQFYLLGLFIYFQKGPSDGREVTQQSRALDQSKDRVVGPLFSLAIDLLIVLLSRLAPLWHF